LVVKDHGEAIGHLGVVKRVSIVLGCAATVLGRGDSPVAVYFA
jgi:hypothetical protein